MRSKHFQVVSFYFHITSKYAVRSNQAGAHPTNPAQPQIIVTNTETQQNYPMTSKDGAYTMRMHTGYDQ